MSKFVQTADHEAPVTTTREGYAELGHTQTPVLDAIRAKCVDCSGGSRQEVKLCRVISCALFPFRLGSNPWRKEMAPEVRQRAGDRFRARNGLTIQAKTDGVARPGTNEEGQR